MKYLFILLVSISFVPTISHSQHFDGRDHKQSEPCITSGENILVIDFVHIWENGEGKDPFGYGSDRAPYPGFKSIGDFFKGWKHGPHGNIHIKVYSLNGRLLKHISNLPGPEWTGSKYEWLDDQYMNYSNFGIYDWDSENFSSVRVKIYESDPHRKDDVLMNFVVNYDKHNYSVFQSKHIPEIFLSTTSLPDYNGSSYLKPSFIHILNEIENLAMKFGVCSEEGCRYFTLLPNKYMRIQLNNNSWNTIEIGSYEKSQWDISAGNTYIFYDQGFNPRISLSKM